jgi:Flp pilus assembly protein TadG
MGGRKWLLRGPRKVKKYGRERGQALVMIALAMTALVAFLALSIDGGMAYNQRRESQNGADSGAVAGAYTVLSQRRASAVNQAAVRTRVNQAVQAHGIPDTDGLPNNRINGNVDVFYTNSEGQILGSGCQVSVNCSSAVANQAWGVTVRVRKPFTTFFAGIVGRPNMTVAANAVGVARRGPPGSGGLDYAVFSTNSRQCGGFTTHIHGGWGTITGNVHTNSDINHAGGNQVVHGRITHVGACHMCTATQGTTSVAVQTPELPDYNAYRALAMSEAQGAQGNYFNRNVTNTHLGTPSRPFTHITGSLTIQNASVNLRGLIYVQGPVNIDGASLNSASVFTLISDSSITFNGNNVSLAGGPYTNPNYPILRDNVVTLYSGQSPTASQVCGGSVESIKFAGAGHYIRGAVLAPHGIVHLAGASIRVDGSLIGSTVMVTGGSHDIRAAGYFPPQIDRIELLQ